MLEKKQKSEIDVKEVAVYREKLQKLPPPLPPLILPNRERQKYTLKSPFPQEFSLPSNIIYYVSRNPAFPNGHLKLISTCKSLLKMSRIIPVKELDHYCGDDENKWIADGLRINLNNEFFEFSKMWNYDDLFISFGSFTNLTSTVVKKIYKFSLQKIFVSCQVLTLGELQILVSGGHLEEVEFDKNVIKNGDGSVAEFENVVELVCCKKLIINLPDEKHGIGRNTANKIIEILSSDQIPAEQSIRFDNIPKEFDFSAFPDFLKANMTGQQHTFDLWFSDELSDAYKNHLRQFVDEIIQIRGIYAHTVPLIYFCGGNLIPYQKLCKMRDGTAEGILRKPSIV